MTREPERVGAGFARTAPVRPVLTVRPVFAARAAAPPEAVHAVPAGAEGRPRVVPAARHSRGACCTARVPQCA
ncbi:hypothetical protein ACG5V6_22105 [Streptomyces chitinivorans]|uniref:Uncharacterized protein n=1 Tax=Streptomyces chitinivorans TaxID=1257027 RepID=A0ABW7HYE9_9ACTN|nr:hypothetical protein [Streptomyces chitinivorans]MDH2409091.1 hypothetical protein [Streptomyces chitinivorans]